MDQILPKRVFPVKNKKSEDCHWILHMWISVCITVHLKLTVLNFLTKLHKKRTSSWKGKQWTPPLNSRYSNYASYHISAWNDNFDFFDHIGPKRDQHYWILHIRISLSTKFPRKLKTLAFWKKFIQKWYIFPMKKRKSKNHHWIPDIGITEGTKFKLKLMILSFWT